MNGHKELLKEREDKRKELNQLKLKSRELEKIMRKDAEASFRDFIPKYEYKVIKVDLQKNERLFCRGEEIDTLIRLDIKPAPGVMHEYTGLHLNARKIAPYMRLNLPVLYVIWQRFLVDKEGKIIPYDESYGRHELTFTGRSICVEPMMRIWLPDLKEGEEEKIEMFAKLHANRIIKIEEWIKNGYHDSELVWTEEVENIIRKEE